MLRNKLHDMTTLLQFGSVKLFLISGYFSGEFQFRISVNERSSSIFAVNLNHASLSFSTRVSLHLVKVARKTLNGLSSILAFKPFSNVPPDGDLLK